jgi:hypothetical protein
MRYRITFPGACSMRVEVLDGVIVYAPGQSLHPWLHRRWEELAVHLRERGIRVERIEDGEVLAC